MKVAVVGATGMVGQAMLKVLEERNFPVDELIPVASEKSVGKEISFKNKSYKIVSAKEVINRKPNIALFSAGAKTSLEWAPQFAAAGCTVIDNSSAWRMDDTKKLVVPELNADVLTPDDKIIANPNCSTIQMVVALNPLYKRYGIKRIIVSTYQSVSGTGKKAVDQMYNERENNVRVSVHPYPNSPVHPYTNLTVYPYPIDLNVLPHIDVFLDNGYTKEEMKMVNETRKIMRAPDIQVSSTCVRVPVKGGHSESVNVEFEEDFDLDEVKNILSKTQGVVLQDDVAHNIYPMPLYAEGKDDVFVGRLRRDFSQPNTLNCWIVSDNLRKGAATNAVQIAEVVLKFSTKNSMSKV